MKLPLLRTPVKMEKNRTRGLLILSPVCRVVIAQCCISFAKDIALFYGWQDGNDGSPSCGMGVLLSRSRPGISINGKSGSDFVKIFA